MEMLRPGVGLAVILINDYNNPENHSNYSVLLGKRKNAHGAGKWAFPGGHIEKYESFMDCFAREIKEETGFEIGENYYLIDKNPSAITNDFFKEEDKHYITLFMRSIYVKGEPEIMEPDKCEEWGWFNWNQLYKRKMNLFLPVQNLLSQKYDLFREIKL